MCFACIVESVSTQPQASTTSNRENMECDHMRYDQGHYEHAPESAWFNIKIIASIVLEIAEILLMRIGQFAGSASDDKDSPLVHA